MLIFAIALLVGSPEEIVQRMSLEEKVGQLFIVPACPERGDDHLHDLRVLIEKYHIGGIILKQGTQESYRNLYEKLKAPELLHCGDAEWGVSMRMRDGVKYPRNLTLGAIQDLSLLEEFGRQVGRECRQVGLHLNFAPVADVNTNPKNPIIGTRSFGEEPSEVAKRSNIVIQAMQEEGVTATVKHYPGHGATLKDSHVELPVIEEMELLPFQEAITHQVDCIMTAHLLYQPTHEVVTFSRDIVEKKLRDEFGFEGLIITDGLNMKAINQTGDTALKALQAGHDLLLYGDHISDEVDRLLRTLIPQAIESIKESVDRAALDAHVIRIIRAKQKLIREIPEARPLQSPEALALKKKLYQQAMTVVSSAHIPLREEFQLLQFGPPSEHLVQLLHPSTQGLKVVAIYEMNEAAKEYLQKEKPEVVLLFTSPYKLLEMELAPTTIVAYERDEDAEEAVVEILFGRQKAVGCLPIKL